MNKNKKILEDLNLEISQNKDDSDIFSDIGIDEEDNNEIKEIKKLKKSFFKEKQDILFSKLKKINKSQEKVLEKEDVSESENKKIKGVEEKKLTLEETNKIKNKFEEINEEVLEKSFLEDDYDEDDYDEDYEKDLILEEAKLNKKIEDKKIIKKTIKKGIKLLKNSYLSFNKFLLDKKNIKINYLILISIIYLSFLSYLNTVSNLKQVELEKENKKNSKKMEMLLKTFNNKKYIKNHKIEINDILNLNIDNLSYLEIKNYQYVLNPFNLKIPYKHFFLSLVNEKIGMLSKFEDVFLFNKIISDNKDLTIYVKHIDNNFNLLKDVKKISLPKNDIYKIERDFSTDYDDFYTTEDKSVKIFLNNKMITKISYSLDNYNLIENKEKFKERAIYLTLIFIILMLIIPISNKLKLLLQEIFKNEESKDVIFKKVKNINSNIEIYKEILNIEDLEKELSLHNLSVVENEVSTLKQKKSNILSYIKNIDDRFINIFDIEINGNKLSKIQNNISIKNLTQLTQLIVKFAMEKDLIESNYFIPIHKDLFKDKYFKQWFKEQVFDYDILNIYTEEKIEISEKMKFKEFLGIDIINIIEGKK